MEPHPQSTHYCCGVYMRVASIRLMDDIRVAFIRGRRLLEGGVYIRNTIIHVYSCESLTWWVSAVVTKKNLNYFFLYYGDAKGRKRHLGASYILSS